MAAAKLTAREAIYKVLHSAGKPMKVPDIIKAGVPMTALSGATPGQTFYSVLYAEAKKPKGIFQRVSKGTFKVRQGATLDAKPQVKPDPKKRSTAKRGTAKRSTAKRSTAKRAPAKSTTTASSARRRSSRSGRA